ncbi:hypothetical protein GCM10011583_74020 [Streptomyces camponoticapitis]|uniref:Uncharacterized protein n=1 Tax=Streptomyces camponoticapitis TaxID=1616125 RepID=A0ABQ2EYN3_9ACTN|nr:hypothetical protein GCM10011583_74020 [Streptomyces camponoticapitis]
MAESDLTCEACRSTMCLAPGTDLPVQNLNGRCAQWLSAATVQILNVFVEITATHFRLARKWTVAHFPRAY